MAPRFAIATPTKRVLHGGGPSVCMPGGSYHWASTELRLVAIALMPPGRLPRTKAVASVSLVLGEAGGRPGRPAVARLASLPPTWRGCPLLTGAAAESADAR